MYFQRSGETDLWTNQHYFKGFSRSLDAANVTRPVPAVTAACMMIERALYEQVGGLWHGYVDGGSEDSDLCIRLLEAGRRNWYVADVELYHLEAQSYRTADRTAHSYNSWLQTHLLGERIEEIMRAQAQGPDAQRPFPRPGLTTYDVREVRLFPERLERLRGFELDFPQQGHGDRVHVLHVIGWVVGLDSRASHIEVMYEGQVLRTAPVRGVTRRRGSCAGGGTGRLRLPSARGPDRARP